MDWTTSERFFYTEFFCLRDNLINSICIYTTVKIKRKLYLLG